MRRLIPILFFAMFSVLCACSSGTAGASPRPEKTDTLTIPNFNADSAFEMIKMQTDFGPRVPGTEASKRCAQWLSDRLQSLGAENVVVQEASVTAYTGEQLPIRNISAQINPDAKKRILLLSHWDSRPWADNDPNPANRRHPIDGANDGASGVGVILELVRLMGEQKPGIGVDVLFVDAEDYGPHADDSVDSEDAWALGTQYWTAHPTLSLSDIRYGILLDMVGGKNATFPREYFSEYYARKINDKIWRTAAKCGQSSRFVNLTGGAITDDHIYLNRIGVPTVDIIESSNPETGSFNPTWHTLSDNIDNIDRATLGSVGKVLTDLIYSE